MGFGEKMLLAWGINSTKKGSLTNAALTALAMEEMESDRWRQSRYTDVIDHDSRVVEQRRTVQPKAAPKQVAAPAQPQAPAQPRVKVNNPIKVSGWDRFCETMIYAIIFVMPIIFFILGEFSKGFTLFGIMISLWYGGFVSGRKDAAAELEKIINPDEQKGK